MRYGFINTSATTNCHSSCPKCQLSNYDFQRGSSLNRQRACGKIWAGEVTGCRRNFMTPWHGNVFCIIGDLWGEITSSFLTDSPHQGLMIMRFLVFFVIAWRCCWTQSWIVIDWDINAVLQLKIGNWGGVRQYIIRQRHVYWLNDNTLTVLHK